MTRKYQNGWMLVSEDVFRPPRKGMLLSVMLGCGTQIFITIFLTLGRLNSRNGMNLFVIKLVCSVFPVTESLNMVNMLPKLRPELKTKKYHSN